LSLYYLKKIVFFIFRLIEILFFLFYHDLKYCKMGLSVLKKNQAILIKGLKDGDSEIDAAIAHKNLLNYTTPLFLFRALNYWVIW
jgi:hypothetical protein